MNIRGFSRILSVLLLVVIIVSMLPASVYADGAGTYTQITSAEQLITGKYAMITDTGFAPAVYDSGYVTASEVTIPDASSPVWTITVNDDGSAVLTDSNGVSIAPAGGNVNGLTPGSYHWAVTVADGKFSFNRRGRIPLCSPAMQAA